MLPWLGEGQGFMREKRHVSGFGYSHRSRQSQLSYDHIFVTFKVESFFVQYVFWSSSEVLVVSYRQIKSFNNRAGNCHALYPALTHGVRMGALLFKGTTSSLFAGLRAMYADIQSKDYTPTACFPTGGLSQLSLDCEFKVFRENG